MAILHVRHTTTYRYSRPVRLGDHRLMLRPRDSHDLRLMSTNLELSPPASIRWMHDVFGNSIAIASFAKPATELRIESDLTLETFAVERPPFQIMPEAVSYPFIYSADDRIDLGRMLERQMPIRAAGCRMGARLRAQQPDRYPGAARRSQQRHRGLDLLSEAGTPKARRARWRRSIADGARAGTSRCS